MILEDQYEAAYVCKECGEHKFKVRYRERNEDITAWMLGVVRPALGLAHIANAPWCSQSSCDLKLPINEAANAIGMRVEQ